MDSSSSDSDFAPPEAWAEPENPILAAVDTTEEKPVVEERRWERAWTFSEMRNEATTWNLSADCGMLHYLEEFTQAAMSRTSQVERDVDDLMEAVETLDISLHNTFNQFLMLSDTQFVENRVYDEDVKMADPDEDLAVAAELQEDMTQDQIEAILVPKYTRALAVGLRMSDIYVNSHDAATLAEDLELEREEADQERAQRAREREERKYDSLTESSDEEAAAASGDKTSAEKSVAQEAPKEEDPVVEGYTGPKRFINPYTRRTLPHVIGTPQFLEEDDIGISFPDIVYEDQDDESEDIPEESEEESSSSYEYEYETESESDESAGKDGNGSSSGSSSSSSSSIGGGLSVSEEPKKRTRVKKRKATHVKVASESDHEDDGGVASAAKSNDSSSSSDSATSSKPKKPKAKKKVKDSLDGSLSSEEDEGKDDTDDSSTTVSSVSSTESDTSEPEAVAEEKPVEKRPRKKTLGDLFAGFDDSDDDSSDDIGGLFGGGSRARKGTGLFGGDDETESELPGMSLFGAPSSAVERVRAKQAAKKDEEVKEKPVKKDKKKSKKEKKQEKKDKKKAEKAAAKAAAVADRETAVAESESSASFQGDLLAPPPPVEIKAAKKAEALFDDILFDDDDGLDVGGGDASSGGFGALDDMADDLFAKPKPKARRATAVTDIFADDDDDLERLMAGQPTTIAAVASTPFGDSDDDDFGAAAPPTKTPLINGDNIGDDLVTPRVVADKAAGGAGLFGGDAGLSSSDSDDLGNIFGAPPPQVAKPAAVFDDMDDDFSDDDFFKFDAKPKPVAEREPEAKPTYEPAKVETKVETKAELVSEPEATLEPTTLEPTTLKSSQPSPDAATAVVAAVVDPFGDDEPAAKTRPRKSTGTTGKISTLGAGLSFNPAMMMPGVAPRKKTLDALPPMDAPMGQTSSAGEAVTVEGEPEAKEERLTALTKARPASRGRRPPTRRGKGGAGSTLTKTTVSSTSSPVSPSTSVPAAAPIAATPVAFAGPAAMDLFARPKRAKEEKKEETVDLFGSANVKGQSAAQVADSLFDDLFD